MKDYLSKYQILSFCLLLAFNTNLFGQNTGQIYSDQPIEARTFEENQWEDLHNTLDYSGERPEPEKPKEETGESPDFSLPDLSPIVKIFAFILLISLIGLIMYHVINKVDYKFDDEDEMTTAIKEAKLLSLEELEEQLDKENVDPYILLAEKQHNYPLAVRLHFLALLKKMSEENLIRWKKDFTNNTYINQMRGKDDFSDFLNLTRTYERVWYGDHHPSAIEYNRIQKQFTNFKSTLKPKVIA